ncbi:hypothetical protein VTN96DRAFT_4875 [Rasamsonia emersonii]
MEQALPTPKRKLRKANVHDGEVAAPMSGNIIRVVAQNQSEVKAGDVLLTIGAMKMEVNVSSEVSGRVEDISIAAGDSVEKGDMLLRIVPVQVNGNGVASNGVAKSNGIANGNEVTNGNGVANGSGVAIGNEVTNGNGVANGNGIANGNRVANSNGVTNGNGVANDEGVTNGMLKN